jgi:hypothetical protein
MPLQPSAHGSPAPRSPSSGSGVPPLPNANHSRSPSPSLSEALGQEVKDVKPVVEYHNHLNGVLSPQEFLYVLFGAGEIEQKVPWDDRLEGAYRDATEALIASTDEKLKQLGIAAVPPGAALSGDGTGPAAVPDLTRRAPFAADDLQALGMRVKRLSEALLQQLGTRPDISPVHVRDLTDRIKLLSVLTQALQPKWEELLLHCLAARLGSEKLPFVHFDWGYTVRSALWKVAFIESKDAIELDAKTTVGSLVKGIKEESTVKTRLGGRVVSGEEKEDILVALRGRPAGHGTLTLIIDANAKERLGNPMPGEKPLALYLRGLQGKKGLAKINVIFTAAARKIFFFDDVFRALSGKDNKLDAVQLQGRVNPTEVSPALVKHLAANNRLDVAFLSTIAHAKLSSSQPAGLAAQEAHSVAKKAFSQVHLSTQVGLPFVGIDVAGPEVDEFTPEALAALVAEAVSRARAVNEERAAYDPQQAQAARGGPTVLRIHAGEAYAVDEQDEESKVQRKKVGRTNCSLILNALDQSAGAKELMSAQPEQLQMRMGHATFMDTQALRKVAELGVILEFNPHSNAATGVDRNMEMKSFLRVLMFNSLEKLCRPETSAKVRFCLSSDGQGVMATTFLENLTTAAKKVNDRLLEPLKRGTLSRSSSAFSPSTQKNFDAVVKTGEEGLQDHHADLEALLTSYTEKELAHAHLRPLPPLPLAAAIEEQDEATSPAPR